MTPPPTTDSVEPAPASARLATAVTKDGAESMRLRMRTTAPATSTEPSGPRVHSCTERAADEPAGRRVDASSGNTRIDRDSGLPNGSRDPSLTTEQRRGTVREHMPIDPSLAEPVREPPYDPPFEWRDADMALETEQRIAAVMWGITAAGQTVNAVDEMRKEGRAVPPPIPLRHHSEFEYDAGDLHSLPSVQLRSWHPSRRFPETLEACARRPDTNLSKTPATPHLPLMWYHSLQLDRATAAGAVFLVEHGPSPYPSSYEDDGVPRQFDPVPHTMRDLHMRPEITWDRQTDWYRKMCNEIREVEKGYRFRYNRIPGGRSGIRGDISELKWQYRRVPWWIRDGRVQPIMPELPDEYTEVKVKSLYEMAVEVGATDMQIASMYGLYGGQAKCFATPTTHLMPSYASAWPDLDYLQEARISKHMDFVVPRLLDTSYQPSTQPCRVQPKGVHKSVKPGGKVKKRAITDPAAERMKACQISENIWKVFTLQQLRDEMIISKGNGGGSSKGIFSKKGPPGVDSINNCMCPELFANFNYGSLSELAEQGDILLSADIPVDCNMDDFEAYFEQYSVDVRELWYTECLISSAGGELDPMGCFGYKHNPDRFSRLNYLKQELIDRIAEKRQEEIVWTPWSSEMRDKAEKFRSSRRAMGASGRYYSLFGWFDDNSNISFRFFSAQLRQIQYDIWNKFHVRWSNAKAESNLYEAKTWHTTLGLEHRIRERRILLGEEKVGLYTAGIKQMLQDAERHPNCLVAAEDVDSMLGKILYACDPVPWLWVDAISLIALLLLQRTFEQYKRFNPAIVGHWQSIVWKLHNFNGRPTTSYEFRPGHDGLPVWYTYTDASRKGVSFLGAAGGWFRMWQSDVIYFFTVAWPPEHVQICNIGELEFMAANIADRLVSDVRQALGSSGRYYTYQFGDNQSVFRYCLNNLHASKHGMRYLVHHRAQREWSQDRMLGAAFVRRGWNKPADAGANMDWQMFSARLRRQFPRATLVRVEVPLEYSDLSELLRWKSLVRSN